MQKLYSISFTLLLHIALFSATSCQNPSAIHPPKEKKASSDSSAKLPQAFIDLLFADHNLAEMHAMHASQPNDPNSVWGQFEKAGKLLQDGKRDEAKKVLRTIANDKTAESRVVLWAWNSLREMGEPKPLPIVLGLVLEVPQSDGCDYLAMYADKRARYVNYQGGGAIWEKRQADVDNLIGQVMSSCQNYIINGKLSIGRQKTATTKVRFSFLTTAGIMQAIETFDNSGSSRDGLGGIFTLSTQMLAYITAATNKQ